MSETAAHGAATAERDPLPVLGVPVRFASAHRAIAEAFDAGFGPWRALVSRPDLVATTTITARVDALPVAGDAATAARSVRHRAQGRTLAITGDGAELTSDAEAGRVVGAVRPDWIGDPRFRRETLEAAILWAIAHGDHDRQPLHAAAVLGDRSGLLLTGRSGAGKSTLTYAAARGGLRVLSDESVFVQRRPLRVWGVPTVVRLAPESAHFFPELAQAARADGSRRADKLEIPLADLGADSTLPVGVRMGICVLERSDVDAPRWSPLTALELEAELESQLEAGFDLFRGRMGDVACALAERGAWRLAVGRRPESWVPALRRLLDEVVSV
jgi:hypothetical protein